MLENILGFIFIAVFFSPLWLYIAIHCYFKSDFARKRMMKQIRKEQEEKNDRQKP